MSFVNSETVKLQVEAFRGAQGERGPAGADGYSPEITLTRGESGGKSGVWIAAANAGGSDKQFVYDGEKGAQGETGPQGAAGATGPAGADGHTPVRGTDYWTADDQAQIVSDVLAALPAWEGGSY